MSERKVAPYGSWKSPFTADRVVAGAIQLDQVAIDGEDIYWLEGRPAEGGRVVLVRQGPDGRQEDVTPQGFNVRTRVHEYGGGAYSVHEGTIFFSNFADNRVYRLEQGGDPRPITTESDMRYADFEVDSWRGRLYCVREDHTGGGEAINTLVALPMGEAGGEADPTHGTVLASGSDFYSTPRLSPDGTRLCWLTWNHPNMPWDGTELWLAEIPADGSLGQASRVAGGPRESIFQPQWSPDGSLYFVSDRTGWWNIYRISRDDLARIGEESAEGTPGEAVTRMEAEFGRPQWVFSFSTYAFEAAERLWCVFGRSGIWRLASIDTQSLQFEPLDTDYTLFSGLKAGPAGIAFLAASPSEPPAVARLDPSRREIEVLRQADKLDVDPAYVSIPEPIEYPSANGRTAHAFFYPPRNPDYTAPQGEKPPVVVMSHGGPTGATAAVYNPSIQYWTSRGIAVLDVNYGGSTGYGREYRERLYGNWGIVDVEDCIHAARHLAEQGRVDGERTAIRGGSAGGYTTLAALTFGDFFKVGASYFGVSDLELLAKETHKFESRYLDQLVGPYPEARELYRERSPIHHVGWLNCPVIFFQGLEDRVVPPNQAELMVEKLRGKGIPVTYLAYEGEGHGFRRAENLKRSLEAELYFYAKILGFELADPVEPVPIDNLEGS